MAGPTQVFKPQGVQFYISCTENKFSLVGFADDISDKYIIIGGDINTIDLPNITVTDKMNQNPVIHVDNNYLISTAQVHEFAVAVQNIYKCHGVIQYINDENCAIPMNYNKDFMYVLIYEPTQ